jgi:hypothetical protein
MILQFAEKMKVGTQPQQHNTLSCQEMVVKLRGQKGMRGAGEIRNCMEFGLASAAVAASCRVVGLHGLILRYVTTYQY